LSQCHYYIIQLATVHTVSVFQVSS